MHDILKEFQTMLCASDLNYETLIYKMKERQQFLVNTELIHSHALLRLCQALHHYHKTGQGETDVTVLLRQVIHSYQQRIRIPQALWQQLTQKETIVNVRPIAIEQSQEIELAADEWKPIWLSNTEEIDLLQPRRHEHPALGDGLLYSMTSGQFTSYQSLAQRVSVHASFFSPPGSTLLVILPTGAGKSLSVLLPVWHESQGGQIKGGTTIVVVPTISLALDQEQRAKSYFDDAEDEYKPHSWIKDTSPEQRATIKRGISNGTLPLLYISPEALVQSELYNICLEAADRGTLKRLVIDEAHLIATWGAGFRTEFQFLATYREQLRARSNGQLRTLLLSATVSREYIKLLCSLFASTGSFQMVQANGLRPEPAYWFRFSQRKSTRENRVIEAVHYLPRPLILYVSRPEEAKEWEKTLRHQGFQRIATFTGDTKGSDRKKLIIAWRDNKIDIMVATSAFGVGIDKSDVRTIIHACLPENIDRFYQEVGRAGRDGFSAVSLTCPVLDDYELAFGMTRAARITVEKAINRWEGMRKTGIISNERSNIQSIDINSPPVNEPQMMRSDANREWNEHTLLLMQRAHLIQIMSTREKTLTGKSVEDDQYNVASEMDRMQILLLDPITTANPYGEFFRQKLEQARDSELEKIHSDLADVKNLIAKYDERNNLPDSPISPHNSPCIADKLSPLYPNCSTACGGCASCRQTHKRPYEHPLLFTTDIIEEGETKNFTLHGELHSLIGWSAVLNITWDHFRDPLSSVNLQDILTQLVWAGMQQLIVPSEFLDDKEWAQILLKRLAAQSDLIPHHILSNNEILQHLELPIYTLPTIIVYPKEEKEANLLYNYLRKRIQQWNNQRIPLIHIINQTLFLERERGYFLDRINGTTETIYRLHLLLKQWQQPIF